MWVCLLNEVEQVESDNGLNMGMSFHYKYNSPMQKIKNKNECLLWGANSSVGELIYSPSMDIRTENLFRNRINLNLLRTEKYCIWKS